MPGIMFARILVTNAVVLLLALIAPGNLLHADAPKQTAEFPQQGLLAAAGNLPSNGVSIPLPIGMKPGQVAPITGGVSRAERGICSYTVANNFEQPIRVSLTLRQYNAALEKTASTSASQRLKPGESRSGRVKERNDTSGCALVLEGWKFQS